MNGRLLIVSVMALLAGCDTALDYRFRLTAEVETPGGVRQFSTVRQVVQTNALMVSSSEAPAFTRTVEGEALVISLPDGTDVFALLGPPGDFPEDAALPIDRRLHGLDRIEASVSQPGVYVLPREIAVGDGRTKPIWPRLTRFTRRDDPLSIVEVDPDALPGGARLRRITIEITEAPVSEKILDHLPWLPAHTMNFSGARYPTSDALTATASRGMFTTTPP